MSQRSKISGREGSTRQLLELSAGYFFFYVLTGFFVKYFTSPESKGFPGMHQLEYLVYSTVGSSLVCMFVIFAFRWVRTQTERTWRVGPWHFAEELKVLIPSGVCTAVVVPTTTLMYLLPISVMVAMVIMRGSIIVVSRLVDEILIYQGRLKRKVSAYENWAVVFALAAVSSKVFFSRTRPGEDPFDFARSPVALVILTTYILAYGIRIYLMNRFKLGRSDSRPLDSKAFFAVEQIVCSVTLGVVLVGLAALGAQSAEGDALSIIYASATFSTDGAALASVSGSAFGFAAFFSVFLFLFKGRSATFNGLVNRLTSLIAGTASTLLFAIGFRGSYPSMDDWIAMGLIGVAVFFLTLAEREVHQQR
jgi:hypothetical protein